MADITVQSGQGVTQAIASNLGLSGSDLKKVKLSVWQEVMTLVKENNTKAVKENKPATYSGTSDISKLNDKSTYHTNFLVHPGQKIEIDDSIWGKIKQLLTGKAPEVKTETPAVDKTTGAAAATGTAPAAAPPAAPETTSISGVKPLTKEEEIKLGEQVDKTFKSFIDGNGNPTANSLDLVDDNWRALANKKDKTDAEKAQLDKQYKESMMKLGSAYMAYIDSKYGNGDGTLSVEEYQKFENEGVPPVLLSDPEAMKEVKAMQENAFAHLDVNGDGKVDKTEMAAYMHAMDFGTEDGKSQGANGKISAYDFAANSLALAEPKDGNNMIDKKLAYTYKQLAGENGSAE